MELHTPSYLYEDHVGWRWDCQCGSSEAPFRRHSQAVANYESQHRQPNRTVTEHAPEFRQEAWDCSWTCSCGAESKRPYFSFQKSQQRHQDHVDDELSKEYRQPELSSLTASELL